jgi:hypothetical protein
MRPSILAGLHLRGAPIGHGDLTGIRPSVARRSPGRLAGPRSLAGARGGRSCMLYALVYHRLQNRDEW